MYSYLLADGSENKTGKGIKKVALKKRISHKDYLRCLFGDKLTDKKQFIDFITIKSKKHELFTIKINKTGLCCYDNKRYIYDGINSLSYGHWRIDKKDFGGLPTY